ncbi:MAG TPA: hypothetical protein DD379_09670 [Cyanobacteria bacterium UBA11162]|nr:hypothetical protein [Cyanobacteria bacterium UBA11162]
MKTLNEWESIALQEIFSLSHTILYSGFDNPLDLYAQMAEVMEHLHQQCQKYEFYSRPQQRKVIALRPEFQPER